MDNFDLRVKAFELARAMNANEALTTERVIEEAEKVYRYLQEVNATKQQPVQ
jgi:hypothetical protein